MPNWLFDVALIYVFCLIVPDVVAHDDYRPLTKILVALFFGIVLTVALWR